MSGFNLEFSGSDGFENELKKQVYDLTMQHLYEQIKEKVPEIESEKNNLFFKEEGTKIIPDFTNLSSELREKLHQAGLLS